MLFSSLLVGWFTQPSRSAQAKAAPPASAGLSAAGPNPTVTLLANSLELEARIGHPVIAAGKSAETYLLFRARAVEKGAPGAPLHAAILVDRSGSMRGKRLDNAFVAAQSFVRRLRDGDQVTVLAYDARVETLVPTTRIDESARRRILERLRPVASGSTCISCALESAITELGRSPAAVRQILLLSDGEPTTGVKNLEGFRRIAAAAREKAVNISSIGVDVDYNEALLTTLARFSNGRHHFVRDPGELEQAFDRELGELVQTVASDVQLELRLPAGIELVEVFDREVERDAGRVRARLGAFAKGEEKTLLVKIRVAQGGPRQALAASFSLTTGSKETGSASAAVAGELGLRASDDGAQHSELDPLIAARLGRSRTGALLFEAGGLFKTGDPRDFATLERKFASELSRIERDRKSFRPRGGGRTTVASGADGDLEAQSRALEGARARLRSARGAGCGCAPSDLICNMRCAGSGESTSKNACKPGDPLCANIGKELSSDEKAAVKESVGASETFAR
jgi:Ca-activated chloride channel family protein